MGEGYFFKRLCQILGVGTVYVPSLERSTDCGCGDLLFGFGVANFIFRRRVAFLFRVAAVYVIGGAMLGSISTLGSGAVFGGCTGGDGATAGKCVGETVDGIVSTLGSD